ncbi:MAG: DMT family transporter [bacterium]
MPTTPSAPPRRRRLMLLSGAAAFSVGSLTALQSRINGELSYITGNGIEAAVVSFGSGWIILSVMLIAWRPMREGLARVVTALGHGELRWWQALGGLLGGFFVAVQSTTVPLIGVAVFTVAVVAGQSANSLVVDRIGLGPAGRQDITLARVLSAVLAVAAVGVAVSDRWSEPGTSSLPAVLAALVAGLAIAVQQAINGRVGRAAGNAFTATWVNFSLGCLLLGSAFGLAWALTSYDPSPLPSQPWWLYLGGVIGVLFIATASWVVQVLGVLLFALLSIAGQLSGALVIDVVFPTAGGTFHPVLVVGVLLAGLAVAVGAIPAWRASRRPVTRAG